MTGNFMAPMGPLKIKTGLPTSPTCQRALITHGQLTVIDHQIPAFAPDWSFSPKGCQLFIDITVSDQTSNTAAKMIGK